MSNDNPLLDLQGLPPFDRIRADHVTPAVDSLLAQAEAALEKAVSPELPADYDALSAVLDVATERLSRAWGAVRHLNAVPTRLRCARPTPRTCRASPSSIRAWVPMSACTPSTRRSSPPLPRSR
jgi:Zn-dependent oligopeptidase